MRTGKVGKLYIIVKNMKNMNRFHISRKVEKDKARMKVSARMFRKGLESEVFNLDAGGLLNGTTSAQMG